MLTRCLLVNNFNQIAKRRLLRLSRSVLRSRPVLAALGRQMGRRSVPSTLRTRTSKRLSGSTVTIAFLVIRLPHVIFSDLLMRGKSRSSAAIPRSSQVLETPLLLQFGRESGLCSLETPLGRLLPLSNSRIVQGRFHRRSIATLYMR